jgi:hypothetical protein
VPFLVCKRNFVPSRGFSRVPYVASVRALQYVDVFEQSLLPRLACSDTAKFVDEAFYTQNAFGPPRVLRHYLLPPPAARSCIRHIKLSLCFCIRLDFISKITDERFGFSTLHMFELDVGSMKSWTSRSRLNTLNAHSFEGLQFRTRELQVSNRHFLWPSIGYIPIQELDLWKKWCWRSSRLRRNGASSAIVG